ncbi:SpoIID/LytB domain-containing protein [Bengtsoniella intestinalis]|uniref:SpoIID/LytB domain-containing protein n=1 Tax=Bengtsoniella intestinalis TaxID=3073143 RepID=UPI00391F9727
MKKYWIILLTVVTFFVMSAMTVSATDRDVLYVGLRYSDTAMSSANLENSIGSGYTYGYFDSDRVFYALGEITDTTVTMSPSGSTDITVTNTSSGTVLVTYTGSETFGMVPNGQGSKAVTWFRGNQYYGAFAYPNNGNGTVNVINVVNIDDYVVGVLPYEMSSSWPLAALEAQAVCARTFALEETKHASQGFDVCATVDCQMYSGLGSGTPTVNATIQEAVDNTAGLALYYNGEPIQAYYSASNGGASESVANVWGSNLPYLVGKIDPYEAMTTIPSYQYTETYTAETLTAMLNIKSYDMDLIENVYISKLSDVGNVIEVTFVDVNGKTVVVSREVCRTIFYSSIYNKSVSSLRYTINGYSGGSYYVNEGGSTLSSVIGVSVLSGSGTVSTLTDSVSVLTAYGTETLQSAATSVAPSDGIFTIVGTGSGHQLGMSQYGAKAMAEQGYTFTDILEFYYTGITIK